ncbi:MAG: RNA-directed DNA polymerase [Rickettsiales bacterium]|nr:RNA-directed DNA polymerase [Rickettsiales bacterium]
MKTHKHLWEEFVSPENFLLALKNAARGKKSKPAVAKFLKNAPENLENLRQLVMAGKFKTSAYRTMRVKDPKPRIIHILPFCPDRLVQHALMNILTPIWRKMFISDSYACIRGRGVHSASRRVMRSVRRNRYVLQCDVRKFFPSISHDIMTAVVSRKINDKKIVAVLEEIIRSMPGGMGMPIGNYTSQWFGNLYLNELDMFAKQALRARDYVRYCDDFCIFSDSREELSAMREKIRDFLAEKLHLSFSKCEIFPVRCGLDFLGYRHFPNFILLRRRNAKKIMKTVAELRAVLLGGINPDIGFVCAMRGKMDAANGWMRHANSHNLMKKVGFLKMNRIIRANYVRLIAATFLI